MDLDQALNRWLDDDYLAASEAATRYVRTQSVIVLQAVGLPGLGDSRLSLSEIGARLEIPSDRWHALLWLLREASFTGCVELDERGPEPRWSFVEPLPPSRLPEATEELDEHADLVGSSQKMFDFVAAAYPSFLQGERSGAYILLRGEGLELWRSYFSAANPLYDVHNLAGALALRTELRRLDRPVQILELGTGVGGATAAVLDLLEDEDVSRVERFVLSDASPAFLVPTLERLEPARVPLARHRFDFNRSPRDQDLDRKFGLLLGTNALHNSSDIEGDLERLHSILEPEGALILSESICGPSEQVHQDFVFNLLPPVEDVHRQPGSKRYSRFLCAESWRRILGGTDYTWRIHVNPRGPELALAAIGRP